jgi:hypothetical protein
MKTMFMLAVRTLALNAGSASAADAVIETPDQLKWAVAPQFGKGVQTAVLAGDPSKEGPYARLVVRGRRHHRARRKLDPHRRRHVYASRQEQGTKSFPPVRSSELIRKRRILLGRKATPSCR